MLGGKALAAAVTFGSELAAGCAAAVLSPAAPVAADRVGSCNAGASQESIESWLIGP